MKITTSYYTDSTIFLQEMAAIRESVPLFLCMKDQVPNPGDYVTLDLFGISVVVQNHFDTIKCYRNLCMHRYSKLVNHKKGNGKLQCPYHGWTYSSDGKLYAIPGKKTFKCDLSEIKLFEFPVYCLGDFVFGYFGSQPIDFPIYFREYFESIEQISSALGDLCQTDTSQFHCNWKVAVENTLESYHVRSVHPDSLDTMKIANDEMSFYGYHSESLMSFSANSRRRMSYMHNLFKHRLITINDYKHIFIFPNLTIASAFGFTFSIQGFYPQSTSETQFVSSLYKSKLTEKPLTNQEEIISGFMESSLEFNRQVFNEDKEICLVVQRGMDSAGSLEFNYMSELENRVKHFQKNIMTILVPTNIEKECVYE